MVKTESAALSGDQVRQWKDEGYLLLRNLIPQSTIVSLRSMLARVTDRMIGQIKEEGLIQDEGKSLPLETRFAQIAGAHASRFGRSWRKYVAEREVFDLHRLPSLVPVIAQLTGTDVIGHAHFNARPKLPDQELTVVPWHQDSSYFEKRTASSLIITCWIPFVPVDENNGCLQIEKRSHHRGLVTHGRHGGVGQYLEIQPRELIDPSQVLTCRMNPGDVLLITNLTNHRSLPTTSPTIRWSMDIRYVRDGDYGGVESWPDEAFKWVIASSTQPETTYEQWKSQTERWVW